MTAPKLVLHPDPDALPSIDALTAQLQGLGIVGAAFELDGRLHYRTGWGFLDHLTFLGCSPAIELDPPAVDWQAAARAGRFCHVHLTVPTPAPRARYRAGQGPRCRACRRDVAPEELAQPGTAWGCPGCGRTAAASDLNWRQSGGSARLFIDIWGIHTGEAVPGEQLLAQLGPGWRFFYIED